jgi:hypothetical protein
MYGCTKSTCSTTRISLKLVSRCCGFCLRLHVVVFVVVQASQSFGELDEEEQNPLVRKRGRGKHTREDSANKKPRRSNDSGSVTESPVKKRVVINLEFTSSDEEGAFDPDTATHYDAEGNEV